MRIEFHPATDAAYIYLWEGQLMLGRDSVPLDTPDGVDAIFVLGLERRRGR
ncbi:MAG: hypothetical protein ABJA81_07100 [Nocardioidaceae bacterium]